MSADADAIAFPAPDDSPVWKPFWQGTSEGKLLFARCTNCDNAFLPARPECPRCLAPEPVWEESAGQGQLISWVVFHMSYDAAFKGRLPYTVAIVELDEGPRMISNIVGADDPEALHIGQKLTLRIEQEAGVAVPRFVPA